MLSVAQAQALIAQAVTPLPAASVPIDEALGRCLTENVQASRTLPPWDNSAMDGYAVRSADLAQGGAALSVVEEIHAGALPRLALEAGQCARIMTGAPLPEGADAVVMQERANRLEGGRVQLDDRPAVGQHVRPKGEESTQGALLLPRGTPVGIPELGRLLGQGLTHAKVHRAPRVAIASSGDELTPVGQAVDGKLVDTNSPMVAALVRRALGIPTQLGLAPDRLDAVQALFAQGLEHDVLITTAGVSVGERDYAREALERLGVRMSFWKVAMKPGKPLAFGKRGETLVFGLPGNPVSALVTFELFVRPALLALQGHTDTAPRVLRGRLTQALRKPAGLHHFVRASVQLEHGEALATPLGSQTSGVLASASAASALVSLPPELTDVPAGAEVDLISVSWGARIL
ncbi:MAG: molybdopterin molybdotransferase MoeA [Myxococcaceae bacterium]|nr:molybdopterin molybdotransferase MoeA [Myxococcaceae bacterium]